MVHTSMADRLGWPRCQKPCWVNVTMGDERYDGQGVVIAERPLAEGDREQSVVIQFPWKGKRHEICCMQPLPA